MRTLAAALFAALILIPALPAADAPQRRYVTLDGSRLLARPMAFAKTLGRLRKGQVVNLSGTPLNGYVKATATLATGPALGWLALRSLQDHAPKLEASAHASGDASAQEVAAATKGFNRQIEAGLRASDTQGGYAKLDQALARTTVNDPRGSLESWRREGRLGEFQTVGGDQ